eukprot:4670708-Pleurochrysis_carterae.AAC.1
MQCVSQGVIQLQVVNIDQRKDKAALYDASQVMLLDQKRENGGRSAYEDDVKSIRTAFGQPWPLVM